MLCCPATHFHATIDSAAQQYGVMGKAAALNITLNCDRMASAQSGVTGALLLKSQYHHWCMEPSKLKYSRNN